MSTQAAAGCTIFMLFLWYVWQNRSRRKGAEQQTREGFMSPEVWARLTDWENEGFRYVY